MTTYAPLWTEGDTVTHTDMNEYSDALEEAYASLGDYGRHVAVAYTTDTGQVWRCRKLHRYLHHRSSGELVDPAGVEDDIPLSEADGYRGTVDLESIDWLGYGAVFECTGVNAVWQDDYP